MTTTDERWAIPCVDGFPTGPAEIRRDIPFLAEDEEWGAWGDLL